MTQRRDHTTRARPVTHHLTVRCTHDCGVVRPVGTTLSYDARDPFAVTAFFHDAPNDVRWTFGRELLLDGVHQAVGHGDVTVSPVGGADGQPCVALVLVSADGGVTLEAPRDGVLAFLASTTAVVPRGREGEHLDVDAAIAACGVLR